MWQNNAPPHMLIHKQHEFLRSVGGTLDSLNTAANAFRLRCSASSSSCEPLYPTEVIKRQRPTNSTRLAMINENRQQRTSTPNTVLIMSRSQQQSVPLRELSSIAARLLTDLRGATFFYHSIVLIRKHFADNQQRQSSHIRMYMRYAD